MKKLIKVKIFHTANGEPTCSLGVERKKTCAFLEFSRMGTTPHCHFDAYSILERGNNGVGYLIPCDKCPLHSKKQIKAL